MRMQSYNLCKGKGRGGRLCMQACSEADCSQWLARKSLIHTTRELPRLRINLSAHAELQSGRSIFIYCMYGFEGSVVSYTADGGLWHFLVSTVFVLLLQICMNYDVWFVFLYMSFCCIKLQISGTKDSVGTNVRSIYFPHLTCSI